MRVLVKINDDEILVECSKIKQCKEKIFISTSQGKGSGARYSVDCVSDFDATVLMQQCLKEGYVDLNKYACEVVL